MKKLLALLLAAAMTFSLVACSSGTEEATDTEATTGTEQNVHVFYYNYSDTYISTVRAALDEDLETAGYEYTNHDGAGSQTTQTEQIQTAIAGGATILAVNLVDTGSASAAQAIVDMAAEKDIPVVFFNREVADEVITAYEKSNFIGTNASEAGHMQGELVGNYVLENYDMVDLNGDGVISYVMFKGQEGNPEADTRTQYGVEDADAVLTEAGKPALEFYDAANTDKFLLDQGGNWSAAAAQDHMATLLTQYNDENGNMVELVIANNDGMAEGAISALQTIGYNLAGEEMMIPVFGVDATDAAKALIADGIMAGTIKQDAEGMAGGISDSIKGFAENGDIMSMLGNYNIDATVNKIRIPYQVYTGE